jgi:hypothetical protein
MQRALAAAPIALTTLALTLAVPALAPEQAQAADNVFGVFDVSIKNDYITPRGLLVTNTGVTTQVLAIVGMNFDGFSVNTGMWNDFDWFIDFKWKADKFTFNLEYVVFTSPPGNFEAEHNLELAIFYADPYNINPHAKIWYAIAGDSTVVTGKRGGTGYLELGMTPTLKMETVTFTAPTWISVGPKNYWGGDSNWGVFSTGVKATYPIAIPKGYGFLNLWAGGQFYHLINGKLVEAQTLIGTAKPGTGGHRNVGLGQIGFTWGF